MDWRQAFRSRVTGLAGGRVYWVERPQEVKTLPAAVLLVVSDGRPQTLKDFDLSPKRVQVDTYGANQKEAWDLAEAMLGELIPGETINGHTFFRADVMIGPRDMTERVGNETVFRVSMDLIVHHAPSEEGS